MDVRARVVLVTFLVAGWSWLTSAAIVEQSSEEFSVPKNLDDLREIQQAVQGHLERARAATICLKLEEGSGTAVVISPEGLVLTAAHVTAGVGDQMTAVFEDGSEYPGISLGLNSETDAAMFQLEGEGPFPYVEMDLEDQVALGDWVFALGHSGGFDRDRGVNLRVGRILHSEPATLQSDALLIGGDSGGPLFNLAGEVIGIHSRVGASKEQSWHVPIREFQEHWEGLKESEFIGEGPFATKIKPGSGFLGIVAENAGDGELKVTEIWEGSPADEAGLRKGDVITQIGKEQASLEEFIKVMDRLGYKESIKLTWKRGEEEQTKEIKLVRRP